MGDVANFKQAVGHAQCTLKWPRPIGRNCGLEQGEPPNRTKFVLNYRTSNHVMNLSECIGLVQHAYEMPPTAANFNINILIASYSVRVNAHVNHKKKPDVYIPHLDKVLDFGYAHMR